MNHEPLRYQNRFGTASLLPEGPILQVRTVRAKPLIDAGYGFDMDTAEKLALITENRRLQITGDWWGSELTCVLFHHSPSEVQVCKLLELTYVGGDPGETLNTLNRHQGVML